MVISIAAGIRETSLRDWLGVGTAIVRCMPNTPALVQSGATALYEDNQGCIALAKNPITSSRSKHIDIKYHFVREQVNAKAFAVLYCPTEFMLADFLTKALAEERHGTLRDNVQGYRKHA